VYDVYEMIMSEDIDTPDETAEEPNSANDGSTVAAQQIDGAPTIVATEAQEEAPESKLFRLLIIASAAFILTVLIMSVASFSDSKSPIPTFFNAHGLKVVAVEVGVILCLGLAAMIVDRRQTLAWHARQHERQVARNIALAEEADSQTKND
jgi:hypothetical protein